MFDFKKYFSGFFESKEEDLKIDLFPESLEEKPLRDIFESIKLYGKNHDTIEECILGLVDKYYNHANSGFPDGKNINFSLDEDPQDLNWKFKTEYYTDDSDMFQLNISEGKDGKILLNAGVSPLGTDHFFPQLQYSSGTLLMLMGQSGYDLFPFRNCRSGNEKILAGRSLGIMTSEIMKRELNNPAGKYIEMLPSLNGDTFENKKDIELYGNGLENYNEMDWGTTKFRN
ncbi:MAG: hypothetical protein ABEK36_04890 [Candidatus Aenigmatarchaeota archaeon]